MLHELSVSPYTIAEKCFQILFIPHDIEPFRIYVCKIHEATLNDLAKQVSSNEKLELEVAKFK
jgi:hypothetical protein